MGQQNNGKGMSIAALVLGIVACGISWVYTVNIVGLVCGVVGIILAVKGKKAATLAGEPTGLATAGLVLSIIGLVLAAIGFLTCTVCVWCTAYTIGSSVDASSLEELNSLSSYLESLQ